MTRYQGERRIIMLQIVTESYTNEANLMNFENTVKNKNYIQVKIIGRLNSNTVLFYSVQNLCLAADHIKT
jgi:hypothetical protein